MGIQGIQYLSTLTLLVCLGNDTFLLISLEQGTFLTDDIIVFKFSTQFRKPIYLKGFSVKTLTHFVIHSLDMFVNSQQLCNNT